LVSSSARVVYAALAGNLAVAAAKFGASALSGSSAMLTEAIHSLVDSADQLLLLTGQSRARKPPDRTHPLGMLNGVLQIKLSDMFSTCRTRDSPNRCIS
jgi:divalent metal cation (Fe/Co/Zn/Cd) transporter